MRTDTNHNKRQMVAFRVEEMPALRPATIRYITGADFLTSAPEEGVYISKVHF